MISNIRTSRRKTIVTGGIGIISVFSGCTYFGNGQQTDETADPVNVLIANYHSSEHTVTVTVTNSSDETVVEGTETAQPDADTYPEIGTFTPPRETQETYTVTAELDGETTESHEIPAGAATGTTSFYIEISSEGELDIYRAWE